MGRIARPAYCKKYQIAVNDVPVPQRRHAAFFEKVAIYKSQVYTIYIEEHIGYIYRYIQKSSIYKSLGYRFSL